ncbi:MAG: tetratricopeptide repeat protein [Candidatus Magnetomorum sp.]|nr:tetratricopeptide repeat protein [Candidatus Magnetomorum sp.]
MFLQLSAISIAFMWWCGIVRKQEFNIKMSPLYLPVGLWVLWITVSLIGATNPYEGILIARQWWTGSILFFVLSTLKWEKTKTLLPVIFWSGCGVAVIGLIQFFLDIQWIPQVRPPASTFGHKNVAIHYIMLTLPAGIALFLTTQDRLRNACYGFGLSLILLYIYTTYTRAGWVVMLGMLGCLSVLLLYDLKKRIRPVWYSGKSVSLLVGIIFGLILLNGTDHQKNFSNAIHHMAGATQSVFKHISDSENSVIDNSFTGRLEVWINSLAMVKEYPLTGIGVGNYRIHFQRYQNQVVKCSWVGEIYRVFNAHNDHIQFLVELGLIGFGLWLFLLWRFFCTIFIALQQDTKPVSRYLLFGPLLAVINILINACFSFPFQMAIPPVLFMTYIGIACSWFNNHPDITLNIPKKAGYAVASFLFVLFLFVLYTSYAMIQSDRHFLKVIVAERLNQWPLVLSESQKVVTYNPYNKEIYSFIGRAELESNQPQKALVSFDRVLSDYPYHINCLANKGMALMKTNKPDVAVSYFKQALHYLPVLIKLRKILVNLYIANNYFNEDLIHELTIIQNHEPDNIDVRSHLAVAYMKISKFSDAITIFKSILQKQPDHTISNTYMALICLNSGDISSAEKFYQNIQLNDQVKPQLLFIMARLALELNKPEAPDYFIRASQKDIITLSQLFDLANAYKNKKRSDEAIKAYQILIYIQPSHAGAHNNLGNLYRDNHLPQQAFKEYLAAVTCEPQNAIFHFNAGLMAIPLKDFQTAEKAFKKAVELKPDWALAHKNLAVLLYENQKKYSEAMYHFSKALNLDPLIENHENIRSILTRHTQILNPYRQSMGGKQ